MSAPRAVTLALVALALCPATGQAAPEPRPSYRLRLAEESLWLHGPGGEPLLDLRPELAVALEPARTRPLPRRAPLRLERVTLASPVLERERGGFAIRYAGEHAGARYQLAIRARPGTAGLELELEVHYALERAVRAEVLRFALGARGAEGAAVLDRAYRLEPRPPPVISDGLAPRLARLGPLVLYGGEGIQALWLRRGERGALGLELELDHEANHPFRPHLRCGADPAARVARGELSATYRAAGSRARARARLLLGEPRLLLPARFPRGRRAALVFTDHADQSSRAKLEALAFGETGASARAGRGLVGRGLAFTKTVFAGAAKGYEPQLDDAGYRALLAELARGGVEVGLHSATGASDPPERTRALLGSFRAAGLSGRTWIDHQPVTNCEAISAQGWDPRSAFHTLPLLAAAGFTLLWSAEDVVPPAGSLNLLAPEPRGERRPALARFAPTPAAAAAGNLRLFTTLRLFVTPRELVRRLSESSLAALERERGLCLAHTYLDTWRAGGRLAPRSLLARVPGSRGREPRLRLRPEIDALFARLAARAAGGLWVASLAEVAAHLEAALAVELVPESSGGYRVRAPRGVTGLALIAPTGTLPPGARLLVDGRPAPLLRAASGEHELALTLAAGREARLSLQDSRGRPLRFFAEAELVLEPQGSRRKP